MVDASTVRKWLSNLQARNVSVEAEDPNLPISVITVREKDTGPTSAKIAHKPEAMDIEADTEEEEAEIGIEEDIHQVAPAREAGTKGTTDTIQEKEIVTIGNILAPPSPPPASHFPQIILIPVGREATARGMMTPENDPPAEEAAANAGASTLKAEEPQQHDDVFHDD